VISVACPTCGAPCRVSLRERNVVACAKCGWRGPPPSGARERIDAAAKAIGESDARVRQLRGLARVLARGAPGALISYAIVAVGVAIWSALVAGSCQPRSLAKHELAGNALPISAAAIALILALPALVSMLSTARKLHGATLAVPPLRAGEPAACRVCGGPIGRIDGVVRCDYCHADNVVDAKLLARAGERRSDALKDDVEAMREGVEDIGETRTIGVIVNLSLCAFAVPMVTVLFGMNALERAGFASHTRFNRYECGGDPHFHCAGRPGSRVRDSDECFATGSIDASWMVGRNLARAKQRVVAAERNWFFGEVVVVDPPGLWGAIEATEGTCVEAPPSEQWTAEMKRLGKPTHAGGIDPRPFTFGPDAGKNDEVKLLGASDGQDIAQCFEWVSFAFDCGIGKPTPEPRLGLAENERRVQAVLRSTVAQCEQRRPPYDAKLLACYASTKGADAGACAAYRACAKRAVSE
jgi:hypothetical protein